MPIRAQGRGREGGRAREREGEREGVREETQKWTKTTIVDKNHQYESENYIY